jgi:hypothetical protein
MEFVDLIWVGVTGAASIFGYIQSRRFVRRKLRFVDAVQKPVAPVVAGGTAALLAAPVVCGVVAADHRGRDSGDLRVGDRRRCAPWRQGRQATAGSLAYGG